jgi:oxygen-independent coproporphyrinogen-3 oxidase
MAGIYIHVPFCVKKCHYCDFYSEELHSNLKTNSLRETPLAISVFVDNLIKEIELTNQKLDREIEIETIFFGGGTPSLLNSEQLNKIVNQIHKSFHIKEKAEFTLECNPGTTTKEKIRSFINLGVNRISFGVQSFIDKELEFLQRIHSPEEAERSIIDAREAGLNNISLDLMFSIPGQTIESLDFSLNKAITLQPEHISSYSLIYEPGTPLYQDMMQKKIKIINDEDDASFYDYTIDLLSKAGYEQYEVSNFAKEKKYCHHNLNYWSGGDYLAFGPSAHGFMDNVRYWNHRSIQIYNSELKMNELPIENSEVLTDSEYFSEIIFLGLRANGVSLAFVNARFGIDLILSAKEMIKDYINEGLLILMDDKLRMTVKGYPLCDEIILNILNQIKI